MPRTAWTLLGAFGVLAASFVACGLPGTGGELVEVEWRFEAEVPREGPVVVETVGDAPWQVEITEARLLVGPAYAFALPPASTQASLRALWGPRRALAHAGDDNTSRVRVVSELLDQIAVDLLDPTPRSLGRTLAEAGPVAGMNVVLDAARREHASPEAATAGGHALLRGVARREPAGEAQEVRFRAVLRTTVPADRIARRVESLPVEGELREGATLELRADPCIWVRQMRFDEWVGQEGEVEIQEPSQLHNAWYLGLRDPKGWSVRVLPPSPS